MKSSNRPAIEKEDCQQTRTGRPFSRVEPVTIASDSACARSSDLPRPQTAAAELASKTVEPVLRLCPIHQDQPTVEPVFQWCPILQDSGACPPVVPHTSGPTYSGACPPVVPHTSGPTYSGTCPPVVPHTSGKWSMSSSGAPYFRTVEHVLQWCPILQDS